MLSGSALSIARLAIWYTSQEAMAIIAIAPTDETTAIGQPIMIKEERVSDSIEAFFPERTEAPRR
jgi:hypothetical protein